MKKRELKMNYRSLTGTIPSQKNNTSNTFESSLERDFIYLLEYDFHVSNYFEQPVTIYYEDSLGKKRHYTPDFLVHYNNRGNLKKNKKPLLCEIKYREELKANWENYKERFKAAKEYGKANGYEFKIFTENEIRTDLLLNAKFLSPFINADFNEAHFHLILNKMRDLIQSSPKEILLVCTDNKKLHPELLYTIWYMISNGFLQFDKMNKLNMNTEIWLNNELV